MTQYSGNDNPESGFNPTSQLKPQGDFQALTLAKWLMVQNVAARPGDNDIESILHELATDSKQLVGLDGVKAAVQDIIVGDIVDHNWQNVNSDGSEGGVGENHDTSNLAARTANYSAPSFSDGNTDNYILIRIPSDSDVRHYRVLINGVEGAITANLLVALGHSADSAWKYYGYDGAELNAFVGPSHTVTLQISDRVLAHSTWAGRLSQELLDQIKDLTKDDIDTAEEDIDTLQKDVDAVEEDIARLKRTTSDIIVNTKTKALGLRDANSDGSEGGIAFGASWDLTKAQAASYTAPTVAAATATGAALVRIPIDSDARHYQVNIVGLGSDTLSHLAIRVFHDSNYQYWEAANFQGEFAVTLRFNPQQVTVTTLWDGHFGEHAAEAAANAVFSHQNVLLWNHTAQARNWHPSGQMLAAGVTTKIYAGIGGNSPWRGLEAEIKWTETRNSVNYEHIGLITFPGWRSGSISTSNPVRLHGSGRFGGLDQTSTLNAILSLARKNDETTSPSHLFIENFNPDGNTGIVAATQLTVRLWGIK